MLLRCFTDKFWLNKAAAQLCDKAGGLTKIKKILGGESFFKIWLQDTERCKISRQLSPFFQHLNSPLFKISPCLTNCMASHLMLALWRSSGRPQNVSVVPCVLKRSEQTYLQHLNVLKGRCFHYFPIPFSLFAHFLQGPWPFQRREQKTCHRWHETTWQGSEKFTR